MFILKIAVSTTNISSVVVVVNLISDRQNKNKDKLLTKQNTTLLIAVPGHQKAHGLIELVAWKFTCSSGNPGLGRWGLK